MKHSEDTVFAAVYLAQRQLAAGKPSAVVTIADRAYVGDNFWDDPDAFTQAVIERETPAQQGVFVVPMLVRRDGDYAGYRQPTAIPHDDEVEELFILAWHTAHGLDIGRCSIARTADGQPVFGDLEQYEGSVQVPDTAPGIGLMRALLPNEETA